ncbi:hypothetical protein CDD83_7368 [Cordyceps sp. RAO-2017]|nr:hypothetical protein CDD83_7368 [Cordyceps sp. RAO-2017]
MEMIDLQQDESAVRNDRGARESKPVFPDEHNKLPQLDFKPLTLRFWFLCVVLIWNLIITVILAALIRAGSFYLKDPWSYVLLKVLPPAIGTITASCLKSIVLNLSRVTPFILCAAGDSTTPKDRLGGTAGDSILRRYFPEYSFRAALATKNGLLLVSQLLEFSTVFILGFKATLLSTTDEQGVRVNMGVQVNEYGAYCLLGFYLLIDLHTVWVMGYLWNRTTGLRWDPTSIADHLVLFRKASFLDEFAGTCIAKSSLRKARLRNLRLRLGYWRTGTELWHGFDVCTSSPSHSSQTEAPPAERTWDSCLSVGKMLGDVT